MDRKQIRKIKIERLANWLEGERSGPVKIDIEPTNTCNLRCMFCWTQSEERLANCEYEKLLSEKRILDIIDEAAELGVVEWQIAGGWEPTVNQELLMDMTKRIKKHGMYGSITTNGTMFTEDMIRTLVKIGWDEILFSLEGSDEETHDSVTRVEGSFDKSKNAMTTFKKWKERLGSKKPDYSFHSVLTNKNYTQLADMIKIGKEIGCTGVNFEPLSVWSDTGKELKLSDGQRKEVRNYAKDALEEARRLDIHTNAENLLREELVKKEKMDNLLIEDAANKEKTGTLLDSPCFDPWLSLEIRVNGRVAPCRICDFDSKCENVIDKPIKDIWYGDYFEGLRKNMIRGELMDFCSDCAAGNVADTSKIRKDVLERVDKTFIGKIKRSIGGVVG